jgi:hypothetical protein
MSVRLAARGRRVRQTAWMGRAYNVEAAQDVVRDLLPELDALGFRVTLLEVESKTGRLQIGYDEPVDVPSVLVDAIAQVCPAGVDFVNGGVVPPAALLPAFWKPRGPRRPTVSIERLIADRDG